MRAECCKALVGVEQHHCDDGDGKVERISIFRGVAGIEEIKRAFFFLHSPNIAPFIIQTREHLTPNNDPQPQNFH